jgi:GTPase SAR1 family protein
VTTKHSLEELVQIIHTVREVKREALADCPTMLVGNKIDDGTVYSNFIKYTKSALYSIFLKNSEVPRETGANLAKTLKFGFIETSAKTNTNITELFQQLLALEVVIRILLFRRFIPGV